MAAFMPYSFFKPGLTIGIKLVSLLSIILNYFTRGENGIKYIKKAGCNIRNNKRVY